jgi:hypothetical protein
MFQMPKDEKCPVCGKGIYISESQNDYCCVDADCIYGHGAKNIDLSFTPSYPCSDHDCFDRGNFHIGCGSCPKFNK